MKTTIKSIVSAAIMGVVTYFAYDIVSNLLGIGFIKEAVSLVISVAIGAITYGILVGVLKVDEINIMTDMVKKKLNRVA